MIGIRPTSYLIVATTAADEKPAINSGTTSGKDYVIATAAVYFICPISAIERIVSSLA